jgi:hypothetical protein
MRTRVDRLGTELKTALRVAEAVRQFKIANRGRASLGCTRWQVELTAP